MYINMKQKKRRRLLAVCVGGEQGGGGGGGGEKTNSSVLYLFYDSLLPEIELVCQLVLKDTHDAVILLLSRQRRRLLAVT